MRMLQLIVFSLFIFISSLGCAAVIPIVNEPTPIQSYESLNSSAPNIQATQVVPAIKADKPKSDSKTASGLESQLNALNQAALLYQQETNQKIERLASQNQSIQIKLQKLTQAMLIINQQLSVLSNTQEKTPISQSKSAASFRDLFKYIAFSFVALLAVLLGILISRQKKFAS